MKKLFMIGLVLISAICLTVPSFACGSFGVEGNIEGANWGNFDLLSSNNQINFGLDTGSTLSGYALIERTGCGLGGGIEMDWSGGVSIESAMDFGNVQIQTSVWHNTNMNINADP